MYGISSRAVDILLQKLRGAEPFILAVHLLIPPNACGLREGC